MKLLQCLKICLLQDSEGRTYLFDLDFNDIDCVYSVDAAHQGNAAHFINHSVFYILFS